MFISTLSISKADLIPSDAQNAICTQFLVVTLSVWSVNQSEGVTH